VAFDGPGEGRLGAVIDIQDAVFCHEGVVLLLVVGHSRGKRGDVPVHVRVALLAAQAQAVHPLGRHDCGYGPGNPVHDVLEREELRLRQVVDPVLDVPPGCRQAIPEQGRVAVEEHDRPGVLIDDLMAGAGGTGGDAADKAPARIPALPHPPRILRRVRRSSGWLGAVHHRIIAARHGLHPITSRTRAFAARGNGRYILACFLLRPD
jgi:hypothetical protein